MLVTAREDYRRHGREFSTAWTALLLGIVVFAGENAWPTLRVIDSSTDRALMQVPAQIGWWGKFILPQGIRSEGRL